MTLTNCYFAINDLRTFVGIRDVQDDDTLDWAANAACRAVDAFCGRIFYDTGATSARTYRVVDAKIAHVDDFSTTTGLVIKTDDNDDGTYETTWTSADYELSSTWSPRLGAVPYNAVRAVGTSCFPTLTTRRLVLEVTARWGWAAVPAMVKMASLVVAQDFWKRKDTPFGIVTGTVDFGGIRVGGNTFNQVSALLGPLRSADTIGIA